MQLPLRFASPASSTARTILLGAALLVAPFGTATATAAPCAITTNPASVTECADATGNAQFTCAWTSLGQANWYVNNVKVWTDPATNAGTSTYVHTGSVNASIYCIWTGGGCGQQKSTTATFTVNSTAVITSNPTPIARCVGSTATFTVAAGGSPAPTYRWRKGNNNLSDAAGQISGAFTATLTLSNIDTTDAGNYRCVVTNSCGSDTSGAAALTVNTLSITTQPAAVSTCAGTDAVFTIAAESSTTPTYQWKKGTTNLSNGNGVLGATTNQLTLSDVDASDAGSYSCVVSAAGGCSSITSAARALTVNSAPAISRQPESRVVCAGYAFNISVAASGTPTPTYQWKRNNLNLSNISGKISGATTSHLGISDFSANDIGSYTCIITNACGTVTSDAANPTITSGLPTIIKQPRPINSCNGDGVFSVEASGLGNSYHWEVQDLYNFPYDWNPIEGDHPPFISGSDTSTITFRNFFEGDAVVRCVVDGPCGTVTSKGAYVFTTYSPVIEFQPRDAGACAGGEPAHFQVRVSELSDPYYTAQWQWLPSGATNWLNLAPGNNSYLGSPRIFASGVDTDILAVTPLAGAASAAQVRCVLSETDTCVTTSLPASLLLCVSDLTCSGTVDDEDFTIFLRAYNILDCADPAMPAACPADLNRDGVVDDSDFTVFVRAYDELVCFGAGH